MQPQLCHSKRHSALPYLGQELTATVTHTCSITGIQIEKTDLWKVFFSPFKGELVYNYRFLTHISSSQSHQTDYMSYGYTCSCCVPILGSMLIKYSKIFSSDIVLNLCKHQSGFPHGFQMNTFTRLSI